MNKQVLVDGDPFAYRAAFSCEDDSEEEALAKVDSVLDDALNEVMWETYRLFVNT
jgi:hypothetical protein